MAAPGVAHERDGQEVLALPMLVVAADASVTVTADDARFAGWKKLELYDGARQVATLEKGPAAFTVRAVQPGYHAFSVLGTDSKGNVRTSNPMLVVVRK